MEFEFCAVHDSGGSGEKLVKTTTCVGFLKCVLFSSILMSANCTQKTVFCFGFLRSV